MTNPHERVWKYLVWCIVQYDHILSEHGYDDLDAAVHFADQKLAGDRQILSVMVNELATSTCVYRKVHDSNGGFVTIDMRPAKIIPMPDPTPVERLLALRAQYAAALHEVNEQTARNPAFEGREVDAMKLIELREFLIDLHRPTASDAPFRDALSRLIDITAEQLFNFGYDVRG